MGVVTYASVVAHSWTWDLHVHIGYTCNVCCWYMGCSLRAKLPGVVLKTADSLTPAVVIIIVKQQAVDSAQHANRGSITTVILLMH